MWGFYLVCIGLVLAETTLSPYSQELHRIFDHDDLNKDGYISQAEIAAFYDDIDRQGDGHVSLQEFKEAMTLPKWQKTDERFSFYDWNKDGDLTKTDLKLLFNYLDQNGDGKMSFNEALIPPTLVGK